MQGSVSIGRRRINFNNYDVFKECIISGTVQYANERSMEAREIN